MSRPQILHSPHPQQPHRRRRLIRQDPQHPPHPLGPTGAQPKKRRPPDTYRLRTETQSLDDIRAALDAAIDSHFERIQNPRTVPPYLQQRMDRRRRRIRRPSTVIRQDDPLHLRCVLGGQKGIFVRLQAFEHDRLVGVLGQPGQGLGPGQGRVCAEEERLSDSATAFEFMSTGVFEDRGIIPVAAVVGDILGPLVMLSLARHGRVERQTDESDGVELVDARQHAFAFAFVSLHVYLPAEGLVGRGILDDLFGRHAGVVAYDLHCAGVLARLRYAPLAVWVGQPAHRGWGDEDGDPQFVAEKGGAGVAFRAVDKDAGSEEDGTVDCVVEVF